MDEVLIYFIVAVGLIIVLALGFIAIMVNQWDVSDCFEIDEKNCTPVEGGTMCILTIKNICPQEYNVTLELV